MAVAVPRRSPLAESLRGARLAAENPKSILNWIATVDHKRIGILYGVTSFFMFCLGGRRGAPHAHAARCAGQRRPGRGPVQPALHDARREHGLPRRDAAERGVLQPDDAADDRRARRRLPAPERLQLLGVPERRLSSSTSASSPGTSSTASSARPTAAGSVTRR